MSTRATYEFTDEWRGCHTIYIHHDGYEQGAAGYFAEAAIEGARNPAALAECFLRGNKRAELTKSHNVHGDTEYRYTVDKDGLLVVEKRYGVDPLTFRSVWVGPWWEFCNKYAGERNTTECQDRLIRIGHRVYTETDAKRRLRRMRKDLREYKANHPEWVGNINGMEADIDRFKSAMA